jgi:hypothetical protein
MIVSLHKVCVRKGDRGDREEMGGLYFSKYYYNYNFDFN